MTECESSAPSQPRSQAEQWANAFTHLDEHRERRGPCVFGAPLTPVEALEMIGEHGARDRSGCRQLHFERVALDVRRDRAGDGQMRPFVVGPRRENERRPPPPLLVPGLRIERQPDKVAGVGNVRWFHHDSFPVGAPSLFRRGDSWT